MIQVLYIVELTYGCDLARLSCIVGIASIGVGLD